MKHIQIEMDENLMQLFKSIIFLKYSTSSKIHALRRPLSSNIGRLPGYQHNNLLL